MAQNKKGKRRQQEQHQRRPARRRQPDPAPKRIPLLPDDEWRVVLQAHFTRRRRQKLAGWVMVVGGVLTAINHLLEHVGSINAFGWFMSSGLQDLVVGFPVAMLLVLAGVILLGQSDDPPDREYISM